MEKIFSLLDEEWRSISGYDGVYIINNYGVVKSFHRINEKIITHKISKKGAHYVELHKNKKRTNFYVHRLVLETFVGPCPEGKMCCHWDDNKDNNFVGNLRWDTSKSNKQDAIRNKKTSLGQNLGSLNHRSSLNEDKVRSIKMILKYGNLKRTKLAEYFDTTKYVIYDIEHNRTWNHVKTLEEGKDEICQQ